MRKLTQSFIAGWLAFGLSANAETNNSGNPPAFIAIDLCSNGIGDMVGTYGIPRMEPDVFDIGLDFGPDGTVDRWLSDESAAFLGRGNSNQILHDAWRRIYYFQLDEFTGQDLQVHIVDKSPEYYLAINSIRVSGADGTVVPNAIKNGFFEDGLSNWTVVETSLADPNALIIDDANGEHVNYSGKFLSTMSNVNSGDFSETAVLVSDTLTLTPVTSFIYGMVAGGGSEFVNLPGSVGSDNASGVYIDIGTETEDPNGQYDPGTDVPLVGYWGGIAEQARNDFASVFLNTSGLENRRAQVVGFDDSSAYHITLDGYRMNWDWEESIIRNGGFDEGIPTPESDPNASDWFNDEVGNLLIAEDHPSGGIPGWQVIKKPGTFGDVWWWDDQGRDDHMSGRAFVGTGGNDVFEIGAEIRSDVFVIQRIPPSEESVFVQFASAQATDRVRYGGPNTEIAFGRLEMMVDVNGNGEFDDDGDFSYVQRNQGMAPNQTNSSRDLWHHPEYRFYVKPEHQGLQAMMRIEDNFGPIARSYGWLCFDDLFVWDGRQARLAFPNSDFEQGTLENWTTEILGGGGFETWLSGSKKAFDEGLVTHSAMNNRSVSIDGDYAVDTAANETGGGDSGMGVLTSIGFELPTLNVREMSISIAAANDQVTIEWLGGNLESADEVDGVFSVLAGAISPLTIQPAGEKKFYRVRSQ